MYNDINYLVKTLSTNDKTFVLLFDNFINETKLADKNSSDLLIQFISLLYNIKNGDTDVTTIQTIDYYINMFDSIYKSDDLSDNDITIMNKIIVCLTNIKNSLTNIKLVKDNMYTPKELLNKSTHDIQMLFRMIGLLKIVIIMFNKELSDQINKLNTNLNVTDYDISHINTFTHIFYDQFNAIVKENKHDNPINADFQQVFTIKLSNNIPFTLCVINDIKIDIHNGITIQIGKNIHTIQLIPNTNTDYEDTINRLATNVTNVNTILDMLKLNQQILESTIVKIENFNKFDIV